MQKISVLMTVYNEPFNWVKQSLGSTVNSLKNSQLDFEVVLVIDNPNYEWLWNLKEYIRGIGLESSATIHVVLNEVNLGLVESLNLAAKVARGDFFARMDADDISCPSRFEDQLAFLKKNNLDFVAGNIDLIDDNGNVTFRFNDMRSISGRKIVFLEKLTNRFWHPTWLMKKSVFYSLNGYRNVPSAEDYDFVVRALNKEYRLGLLGKVVLKKRVNPNSISELDGYQQKIAAKWVRMGLMRPNRIQNVAEIKSVSVVERYKYIQINKKQKTNRNNGSLKKAKMYGGLVFNQVGRLIIYEAIKEKLVTAWLKER
ncbi:glycosyltransferase [Weissella confusa]|uniref:glycosyltransferase n=1 Tax=Weissella confusa TaxID=1583 RepID=UPI0018F21254|nr:glycosyltransferase [Weissella confusa]MBJ7671167.1 glycosyltransferase [Weissella confusa]